MRMKKTRQHLPASQQMLSYHKDEGVMLNGKKIAPYKGSNKLNTIDINSALLKKNNKYTVDRAKSCVVSYFNLITGKIDGLVFSKNLLPWDHTAGTFILSKLNGHSAFIDGKNYVPKTQKNTIIAAKDKKSWKKLQQEASKWLKP